MKYKGGGILTLPLEIIGLLIIVVGAYLYFRVNSNVLDGVVLKNDSDTMSLNLYVQDKEIAKIRDCGVTKKVIYQVPKTSAVVDASLKILFANELSQYGVYKSVVVSDGLARITLASSNTPSGRPISGLSSCESSHLMSVLQDTLTQYSSIKKVEIYSPEGKIEF